MHDPMVVAFEIARPWPQRSKMPDPNPGRPRWQFRYSHASRWKLWQGWRKFWTIAGRTWYWPPLVTVWHVEPGGHDALTVCGRDGWRWHVHHWRIQLRPVQKLKRWLFERCELCGHRYPYGYAPVSHQWDQPAGKWWRVQRRAYHHACSSLVNVRRTLEQTEEVLQLVLSELRLRTDETEYEVVDRLTRWDNHAWAFYQRHRLERAMGYERSLSYDDDLTLVKREKTWL